MSVNHKTEQDGAILEINCHTSNKCMQSLSYCIEWNFWVSEENKGRQWKWKE